VTHTYFQATQKRLLFNYTKNVDVVRLSREQQTISEFSFPYTGFIRLWRVRDQKLQNAPISFTMYSLPAPLSACNMSRTTERIFMKLYGILSRFANISISGYNWTTVTDVLLEDLLPFLCVAC
jgi:hypothetical protein